MVQIVPVGSSARRAAWLARLLAPLGWVSRSGMRMLQPLAR